MGIEIERRFLVENNDWKNQVILSESFSQIKEVKGLCRNGRSSKG